MNQGEQPILQCVHVCKQKDEFLLSDIDFTLEAGYVLGVIGRNGTGKTTLLRTLLGSYQLTEGDILLQNASLKHNGVKYKEQIAYVLNDTPFPLGIHSLDCGLLYGGYYASFNAEKYRELLKEFEVPSKVAIKSLSKGQQIKQQLAFALSYEAQLYIMDEPTANLDVEFREKFYGYMRNITAEGTKGIVFASHLVDELEQISDYLFWIGSKEEDDKKSLGVQQYFGSMEELRNNYQLVEASLEEASEINKTVIIGTRIRDNHQEMLVQMERSDLPEHLKAVSRYATLKEIMYYIEKGKGNETDSIKYLDR